MTVMKNWMKYTIGAFALVALTACGSEGGSKFSEVTFTTEVATRAVAPNVVSEFASGDRMNIYKTEKAQISLDVTTAHQAVYGGGDWKGSPAITLNGGETAYFFAAYPYQSGADNPLEIPVDVTDQVDVLYSGAGVSVSESSPSGLLTMHHAMSIIAFNIQSYIGGKLQSIEFDSEHFPLAGTMRITSGRITATEMGPYTYTCAKALTPTGWTTDHPGVFAIPYSVGSAGLPLHFTIDGKRFDIDLPKTTFAMAKKYIYTLIYTDAGLLLKDEKPVTIDLNAGSEAPAEEPYSHVKVVVNYDTMTAPAVTGTNVYGYIFWGDDSRQDYVSEQQHSYPGMGPYTMMMDLWNAETFSMTGLKGVSEIDLSKF